MRRQTAALALLLALVAHAEDEAGSPRTAAEAVLAAVAAGDDARLSALAAQESPDPWLVAEYLCATGAVTAADRFARASDRYDLRRLADYVRRRSKVAVPDAVTVALDAAAAKFDTGDVRGAIEALGEGAPPAETVPAVAWHALRGRALGALDRFADARRDLETAAETAHALGWWAAEAGALQEAGESAQRSGDATAARTLWYRRLALEKERSNPAGVAEASLSIASVHGDEARIIALIEQAFAYFQESGDRRGAATALRWLGVWHGRLGNYPRALAYLERARAIYDELGDEGGLARTLDRLGRAMAALGNYASAIEHFEGALSRFESRGEHRRLASTLASLGRLRAELGETGEAKRLLERAIELSQAEAQRGFRVLLLVRTADLLAAKGESDEAISRLHEALELSASDPSSAMHGRVDAYQKLGRLHNDRDAFEAALPFWDGAVSAAEELGSIRLAALGTLGKGEALIGLGRLEEAEPLVVHAVRRLERIRNSASAAHAYRTLADLRLRQAKPAQALQAAHRAAGSLEGVLGGLSDLEAAAVRERFADVFRLGARAALEVGDVEEAWSFLEMARAPGLLAGGQARALRENAAPEALRAEEAAARARVMEARAAYGKAVQERIYRRVHEARRALEAASDRLLVVSARIQREAKRQAGFFYPRAAALAEVRSALEPHEALVLYGVLEREAVALVLRPGGARLVRLGPSSDLERAADALGVLKPDTPAQAALDALRQLLVDPLELGDEVTRLLVSPAPSLTYLPFGALTGRRAVALVPSATTLALLREEGGPPGEGVLALGDPDYGSGRSASGTPPFRHGRPLTRLPATRMEAEAVGTTVLLGAQATEQRFREELASRPRWRAVHFACHAVIDARRPMLSALALTRTAEDDGLLTALEVARLEVPSDLVTLAAADSGRGRIVEGEGLIGLPRAFLNAGARRVLCSLCKVDDEATCALMTKLYALLAEGDGEDLDVAEALRQAQAHVRAQEKWAHPYYWAGWALWGLP